MTIGGSSGTNGANPQPGLFNEPWGVAVAPDNSVYVADTWNHRIQKFTPDGALLQVRGMNADTVGTAVGNEGGFFGPRGIAVDANGRVIVADTGNKRVQIFDATGKFIAQFGGSGWQPGGSTPLVTVAPSILTPVDSSSPTSIATSSPGPVAPAASTVTPLPSPTSTATTPLVFPKSDRHPSAAKWERGSLSSVPGYNAASRDVWQMDLRSYDLSGLDLSKSLNNLLYADFDARTKWPSSDKMPTGFDWQTTMDVGKNPGLGIRSLHAQGITGRGVGLAIIDQPLLVDHQEYADRMRLYEEINFPQTGEGGALSVAAFIEYAHERGSVLDFLQHIRKLSQQKIRQAVNDGQDAVTLSTIHQAKGLEWPNIFAPDCNQGTLLREEVCVEWYCMSWGMQWRRCCRAARW